MSRFYQSSVKSYSCVYSRDSKGKLTQSTEKYYVNDHNGKRHGKIYQEQVLPGKINRITRDLSDNEIDTVISRKQFNNLPKIKSASIKNEIDSKMARYQKSQNNRLMF